MNRRIDRIPRLTFGQRVRNRTATLLAGLALSALCLPGHCLAGEVIYNETFDVTPIWGNPDGGAAPWASLIVTNGQATIRSTCPSVADYNVNTATGWRCAYNLTRKPDCTYVFSTDIVGANQDDAFFLLEIYTIGSGAYYVVKDQDEIGLMKLQSWPPAFWFWHTAPLQNTNITLSMAFTEAGSNLVIAVTVLDRASQVVLFSTNVVDTPEHDPVLPTGTVKGHPANENDSKPYRGTMWRLSVGLWYFNTTTPPVVPVDVTIDNVRVLEYANPTLEITNYVCLSWPEDTSEEQIVVAADSLPSSVWTPYLEPMFKRGGKLCVAVPTTQVEQYFKLVPGTQFRDDFGDSQGPWGCRYGYHGIFQDSGERYQITTGVLRVYTTGSWNGGFGIEPPPELGVAVRDFHAAVDVLSATTATSTWFTVALCARVEYDEPKMDASACMGGIILNQGSVLGNVRLFIHDNVTEHWGTAFNFNPSESYRIEFSGVGPRLTLRVWNKTTGLLEGEMSVSDTKLTQGSVAFWLNAPPEGRQEVILDNFIVTGTKP